MQAVLSPTSTYERANSTERMELESESSLWGGGRFLSNRGTFTIRGGEGGGGIGVFDVDVEEVVVGRGGSYSTTS